MGKGKKARKDDGGPVADRRVERVRLGLDSRGSTGKGKPVKQTRENLSAVAAIGRHIFLAEDETASVHCLARKRKGDFAETGRFDLADYFDLPGGPDGEMDIEGLDIAAGCLWVVGSHSLAREKPKDKDSDRDALIRLTGIKRQPNRHFLGRLPLETTEDGPRPVAHLDHPEHGTLQAACLAMGSMEGRLTRLMRQDEHLAPFMDVPAKENGFDIEGIAVHDPGGIVGPGGMHRVFLGLRGPVLRGWAVIVELKIEQVGPKRLDLAELTGFGQRYCKHFLDLGGLGIRDLAFVGDDLLILAGPTMDLDGPVRVYRWGDALTAPDGSLLRAEELKAAADVLEVPHGQGADHAEGIAIIDGEQGRKLLVLYDSPADERLVGGSDIEADLLDLPGRRD